MKEPVRILHVLGNTNLGGAESRIMDLYRHMDREKIQFDFMVHSREPGFYEEEIRSLGGRIYRVPRFRIFNYPIYVMAWNRFFREHRDFAAVHGHITSSAAVYLPIARKHGIPMTIAHARSAGVDAGIKGRLTRFMRRNLAWKADYLFACSTDAAVSAFGEEAVEAGLTTILPNAIDCGQFCFDEEAREKERKALGVEEKLVIGHVGRFHYAKNHEYLLRIFAQIMKQYEQSDRSLREPVLCMFGEGPLREGMKELAGELGIAGNVRFFDNRRDIWNCYQAMDYFLYPSRYEGMPGTVVEAQSNGLMILMSDTICDEVIATELVRLKSIEEDPAAWAEAVLSDCREHMRQVGTENFRVIHTGEYPELMKDAGFDVTSQAERLARFYLQNRGEEA